MNGIVASAIVAFFVGMTGICMYGFVRSLFKRSELTIISLGEEKIVLETSALTRKIRWDLALYGNICAAVGIILLFATTSS